MTFDEAIERVNEISEDQVDDHLDTAMWLIGELRQEYAPIVEMTQHQYEVFTKYRYGQSRGDIEFGGIWLPSPYCIMDYFKEYGYYGPIPDNMLAQAWLHPETIKVVD